MDYRVRFISRQSLPQSGSVENVAAHEGPPPDRRPVTRSQIIVDDRLDTFLAEKFCSVTTYVACTARHKDPVGRHQAVSASAEYSSARRRSK